jgi:uncharacterized membrane protein
MTLLAHSEGGQGWGGPFEPWEFHPALTHFPIALLLGAVALDLYAWWRGRPGLAQIATGMLVAGLLTGVLAALAGVLAFFTVPAHTEEAHELMFWHMAIQATALLMFACPAWERWRNWSATPSLAGRLAGCLATVLLSVGSAIGGYIVYHGGAGVRPELLTTQVKKHGHGHHDQKERAEKDASKEHHKKDATRNNGAEEQEASKEHERKGTAADKGKPAEKQTDAHKGHDHKGTAADKGKPAEKQPDADKGHDHKGTAADKGKPAEKQPDAHKGHDHKGTAADKGKPAEKQPDAHKGHEQKGTASRPLPEVPPASASAAQVPNGYYVQIVLRDLNYPTSLEFDDKGNVYVAEGGYAPGDPAALPRIIRVQLAGEIETIASEGLAGPVTGLRWHQGKLYISHKGKISAWSEKEKLVDVATGLPSLTGAQDKPSIVGPDGNLYFWRGHRVLRLDSKTGAAETFFGRIEDFDHHQPKVDKAAKVDHHHDGKPTEKKAQERDKQGNHHAEHKDQAKATRRKHETMQKHDMNHDGSKQHEHPVVADGASPGPRRIMDARFLPRGDALYVVDFGAVFMTPDGPRAAPRTGVVWRIVSDNAPAPVVMP